MSKNLKQKELSTLTPKRNYSTLKKTRGNNLPLIPMLCLITILIAALMSIVSFSKINVIDVKVPDTRNQVITYYQPRKRVPKLKLTVMLKTDCISIGTSRYPIYTEYYREMWKFKDDVTNEKYLIEATDEVKKGLEEDRMYHHKKYNRFFTIQEKIETRLLAVTKQHSDKKPALHKAAHNAGNDLLFTKNFVTISANELHVGDTVINATEYKRYLIMKRNHYVFEKQLDYHKNMFYIDYSKIAKLTRRIDHLKNQLTSTNYLEVVTSTDNYYDVPIDLYQALFCKLLQIRNELLSYYIDSDDITILCDGTIKHDNFLQLVEVVKASGFKNPYFGMIR